MQYSEMTATCRATEDMYVAPGDKCMHAVMASVDTTPEQVHCTMIFETEGVI